MPPSLPSTRLGDRPDHILRGSPPRARGLAAAAVARQRLTDMEWEHAHRQADLTATDIRTRRLMNPITPQVTGADLIQVVAPDHHVVASSAAASDLPPMTSAWPTRQEPQLDVQTCGPPRAGCVSGHRAGRHAVPGREPVGRARRALRAGPRHRGGLSAVPAHAAAVPRRVRGGGADAARHPHHLDSRTTTRLIAADTVTPPLLAESSPGSHPATRREWRILVRQVPHQDSVRLRATRTNTRIS
jgi:hypothetical protein